MTDNDRIRTINICFSEKKHSTKWNDKSYLPYKLITDGWDDELFKAVFVTAITRFDWKPEPTDIIKLAVELESNLPDEEEAFEEVIKTFRRYGRFAKVSKEVPGLRVEGTPDFSHPIISKCVEGLGGWLEICDARTPIAILRSQFRDIFQRQCELWFKKSERYLSLPPAERLLALNPKAQLSLTSEQQKSLPGN